LRCCAHNAAAIGEGTDVESEAAPSQDDGVGRAAQQRRMPGAWESLELQQQRHQQQQGNGPMGQQSLPQQPTCLSSLEHSHTCTVTDVAWLRGVEVERGGRVIASSRGDGAAAAPSGRVRTLHTLCATTCPRTNLYHKSWHTTLCSGCWSFECQQRVAVTLPPPYFPFVCR
jgi:hypothetical protein